MVEKKKPKVDKEAAYYKGEELGQELRRKLITLIKRLFGKPTS